MANLLVEMELKLSFFPMSQVLDRMGVKELMEQLLKQVSFDVDARCD